MSERSRLRLLAGGGRKGKARGRQGGGQPAQSQPSRLAWGCSEWPRGEPGSPRGGLGRAGLRGLGWVVLCRLSKRKCSLQVQFVVGVCQGSGGDW